MAPRGIVNPKPWASPLHAGVPWNDKRWPPCGRTPECFCIPNFPSAIFYNAFM